jgi:hypothetical protein
MARTRISFNVARQFVYDTELAATYDYARRANPTVQLYMDGLGEALRAYEVQKHANPDTEPVIIHREFSQLGHDFWYKDKSGDDFLRRADETHGRENQHIWVYLLNEPHKTGEGEVRGFSRQLRDIMDVMCDAGYKIVIGNFSAGTVDHPEWMHEFIDSAAFWGARGRLLMSEHWYTMGSMSWGYGLRRLGDGRGEYAQSPVSETLDYMHPRHWLSREQVAHAWHAPLDVAPMWHYGRIKRFYSYARERGFDLPPLVLTEGFLDDMPDLSNQRFERSGIADNIKGHLLREYGKPAHIDSIKGDISYRNVFEAVYDVTFEQALFMQLAWMDRTMPPEVLGVTLFSASNSPKWASWGHNYLEIPETWQLLVDEAERRPSSWDWSQPTAEDAVYLSFDGVYTEGAPAPEPAPEPSPAAPPVWKRVTIAGFLDGVGSDLYTGRLNARRAPSLSADVLTILAPGDVVDADVSGHEVDADGYTWTRARVGSVVVWVALRIQQTTTPDPTPAPDVDALLATITDAVVQLRDVLTDRSQP